MSTCQRGQWYDVTRHRVIRGPADLTRYAAELSQTPTFIRLGTRDTGTLMHTLAAA
jgi:alpha-glucosidase (family GH31 glycosyl hydrolase)